jgi:carbon-monoxide dehydrogenase large subunit
VSAHGTRGSGMTWVGRAIRRLEDPALIRGQGRFTADAPATHWVRFVRSPVAAGKLRNVGAPADAVVITSTDLRDVKKITPMLHKFNYKPVGQPVLADGVVRFIGEPVAAVVARSEEEAEDIVDRVELSIDEMPSVTDARDALKASAPQVHAEAAGNIILEGKVKTPGFDSAWSSAHKIVKIDARSRRQNATPLETRGGHAAYDAASGRISLTCSTQMPHLTRTAICDVLGIPESDLRVIAPDVGGGFGQKMSLPGEYVVLVWLARKLKSSVAWAEDRRENLIASFHSRDRRISFARPVRHAGRRFRPERETGRLEGGHRLQHRRLFVLSDHMRGRAADGHGGDARPLRRAAVPVPCPRRHHEHLHHGAVPRRVAAGHHIHARAINGQGGANPRPRPDRHPPAQPH